MSSSTLLLRELRALSKESSRFDQLLFDELQNGLRTEQAKGGRTQLDGLVQRASTWLRCRDERVTASMFGILAEQSDYKDAYAVWCWQRMPAEQQARITQDNGINKDIERGINYELTAIKTYETYCERLVQDCGFFLHRTHDWLGASPDGLLEPDNGLIEVKCPRRLRDMVPHDHMAQIQGQLEILDRDFCDYIQWHSRDGLHVLRVYRSRPYWDWLLPFLIRFRECVLNDVSPKRRSQYDRNELMPPRVRVEAVVNTNSC